MISILMQIIIIASNAFDRKENFSLKSRTEAKMTVVGIDNKNGSHSNS